jgi:hypothetical protein
MMLLEVHIFNKTTMMQLNITITKIKKMIIISDRELL